MLPPNPKTRVVLFNRATMINGKRQDIGTKLELPFAVASELIYARKASAVAVETPMAKPVVAEPEKAAAPTEQAPSAQKGKS